MKNLVTEQQILQIATDVVSGCVTEHTLLLKDHVIASN